MDYGPSDSSGTDDDLPPPHQNRGSRGRITVNGRTGVALTHPRTQLDMETQIHQLEQEAYSSLLRAFKAQSDTLTWDKEGLITGLRKELKISDIEHRELLSMVSADEIIRRIREWRQAGGGRQSGFMNNAQLPHDSLPSPSVSGSRKRKNASQSIPSLSLNAPSPAMHSQLVGASMQPSLSAAKHGASGAKSKKTKPISSGLNGRGHLSNRNTPGVAAKELAETAAYDPLIGRKVMTRWPEDKNFYEAVITDFDQQQGLHALVYDINTNNETWEWVNLKEISPEDIRWEGMDPGFPGRGVRGGAGRGIKKAPGSAVPAGVGRGRGPLKHQSKKELGVVLQNGIGKRGSDNIEILHTDSLLKEVERLFIASNPDPADVDRAKKLLKEHEQALIDAIARLADASDSESG